MLGPGKIIGVGGLVVGAGGYRVAGGLMLLLDGLFISTAVALCILEMNPRAKEEVGHKEVLAQMIREGTLKQYLRDLQIERV